MIRRHYLNSAPSPNLKVENNTSGVMASTTAACTLVGRLDTTRGLSPTTIKARLSHAVVLPLLSLFLVIIEPMSHSPRSRNNGYTNEDEEAYMADYWMLFWLGPGGHKVIATSRNPSRTPELVEEVESKRGKWLQLNVNSPSSGSITVEVDELERAGEQIDVLINNAGFSIFAPIETISEDEIRDQMEIMYFGPLRLIRAVLPYQRQRKSGVIANFSSGAALEAQASMGGYAGAKGGLDGKWTFIPITQCRN
ncbi:hypothetical protein RRF57_005315 [Xylaria bambusicola]|uniref:NAD(P)-binding protein n=1 Tax=Xylaria bambusicola TaxID=326684 RepID=A0AAN7YXN8_9PEZI